MSRQILTKNYQSDSKKLYCSTFLQKWAQTTEWALKSRFYGYDIGGTTIAHAAKIEWEI